MEPTCTTESAGQKRVLCVCSGIRAYHVLGPDNKSLLNRMRMLFIHEGNVKEVA